MNKLLIFIICLGFIYLIGPVTSYFSQDDFFHLRVVSQKNISDIPSFFLGKQQEYGFFRPLSRETYNLIMYKIFDLNPFPYHLMNLLVIIINGLLVFHISKKITGINIVGLLASFLYLTSSVRNVELYYLSSIQTLFATTFLILATLGYLNKRYLLSLILFFLALLCHEIAIVFPGIIFLIEMTNSKKILKLSPFFLVVLIYLLFTSFTSLPNQQVYQLSINPKSILNTFGWYTLWSFGLPEMLVDFVGPGFKINENFISWFPLYSKIVFPLFLFISISFFSFVLILKKKILTRSFLLTSSFFIISISPFLFFPQKKFVYYLDLASVWFAIFLSIILFKICQKSNLRAWVVLIVMALSIVYKETSDINKITYWAAKRSKSAEYLVTDLKNKFPNPPKGAVFYIKDDPDYPFISKEWGSSSKQAFYILSGSDAFKLIYKDSSIKAYYQANDPEFKESEVKFIPYTAKFPY